MVQSWLKVIHILGVTLWIGGVVSVGLAGAYASTNKKVMEAARHVSLRVATPGLLLAWIGGLSMFFMHLNLYKAAWWMHGKLTLALIAAALSGVLSGKLRKAAAGRDIAASTFRKLSISVLLIAFLNIIFAFVGPAIP